MKFSSCSLSNNDVSESLFKLNSSSILNKFLNIKELIIEFLNLRSEILLFKIKLISDSS